MKKAVIATGGKQYIVAEGETVTIEKLKGVEEKVSFDALMVIDGENTIVGAPLVKDVSVKASVIEAEMKGEKTVAIRYKAKKRVHKLQGHRQRLTVVRIDSIAQSTVLNEYKKRPKGRFFV